MSSRKMTGPAAPPPFPRAPLFAAGAAIAFSLVLATVGHLTGIANSTPHAAKVTSRELFFRDEPNGAVDVADARAPQTVVDVIAPGTNGFLRATLRTLAQQRKREDEGASIPFRLTEWADGRLTLEDPADGRIIEMEAFGVTNEEAFARLLTVGTAQASQTPAAGAAAKGTQG